jgi:DNA-binding CsgD family transcriptional regulator
VQSQQFDVDGIVSPLATLWAGFAEGALRFHASSCDETSMSLALLMVDGERAQRASTDLRITERALLGVSQKELALEHELAASTIHGALARCLKSRGFEPHLRTVPALLIASVHAHHQATALRSASCMFRVTEGGDPLLVYRTPRLDGILRGQLTHAEFEVASLCILGGSHASIAQARGASLRTVANQLRCIAQKLGVAGRVGLIAHCLRTFEAPPATPRENGSAGAPHLQASPSR